MTINIHYPLKPVPSTLPIDLNINSTSPALKITQTGLGDCLLVEDSSNPDSTPFVIDGNGNVIKGFNTQLSIASEIDGASLSPGSEIVGLGFTPSSQAFINFTNSTTNARGAFLSFARSNGSSIGTHTIVSDANELGVIGFQGSDGTSFVRSASIKAIVDGAPGSSSMPGRLVFSTTPSGSTTPSERLRIDNQGRIGISSGTLTGYCVRNALNITGATTSFGIGNTSVIQSDVTTLGVYYYANVQTAAASFTLSNLYCYQASQGTFGVGSTVTNLHGYVASSTLVGGANNNFGFYGNIPAQSVTAGSFVNGSSYKITSLGTTDFTLIGATSNTLGLFFTATGAGTGTGTADKVGRFNFFANGTAENRFQGNTVIDVSTGLDALRVTQRGAGNALVIEDSTNPDSSPFVIDAAGLVVCGFTENIDGYQIQSHNGNPLSGFRWSASSGGATVALKKSRSTTINSFSIVSSGDTIGSYEFFGDDGAAFQRAARISAAVDAAPAAGSMPGRLTFLTTPSSSTTPSERMRIDSVGFVGINKTDPTSQLHLGATAGVADSGTIGLDEKDTTPANPASGTACKIYMKADKFIIQYNDAGTVRYKYLDLTGTGVTWVATTTAP